MIFEKLLLLFYFFIYHFLQRIQRKSHLLDFLSVQSLQKLPRLLQFFEVNFDWDSFDDSSQSEGFGAFEFVNFLDDFLRRLDLLLRHGLRSRNAIIKLQLSSSILSGLFLEAELVAFGNVVDSL